MVAKRRPKAEVSEIEKIAAENLGRWAVRWGRTYQQVADEVGIHVNVIEYMINSRHRTTIDNWHKVSQVMGVPFWALFSRNGLEARSVVEAMTRMNRKEAEILASVAERFMVSSSEDQDREELAGTGPKA